MEAEQRIQALEQEVQILKTQIQAILLDIQTHLLTNAYPALRGHHTASSSTEEEDDDDEYDRAAPAAPAPKVRKVMANSIPAKQERAVPPSSPVKVERAMPPVSPAEPMMASLDDQQDWVLQNIQSVGVSRTRDLIDEYTQKRRFSPEVSDTLMRFTDMYAAAADEPTLPSRPAGMPGGPVTVKAVTTAPTKQLVKARTPQRPVTPVPAQEAPKPPPRPTAAKPRSAAPVVPPAPAPVQQQSAQSFDAADAGEGTEVEASSLVLRLIAGVQNAGAGVRWGKNKN
jgi:hypothetical protein